MTTNVFKTGAYDQLRFALEEAAKMARRSNKIVIPDDRPTVPTVNTSFISDFDSALTLFLRELKTRGRSEHTIVYYRRELLTFKRMLARQNLSTDPRKITSRTIKENIILPMMNAGREESAINARLRAARAMFNFLRDEGYLAESPMSGVKLLTQKRKVVETFSDDQLRALLRQPDQSTFTGFRDYTAMLLLLETGVRVKELVNIRLPDIIWQDNRIKIAEPKGVRERLVPIQAKMKKQLRKYVAVRGELDHDFLFVTIDNTPLTTRQIQARITKYGRQAGIKNVRCSPHTFRHTFARLSVRNGADAFTLRDVLGHTSLEMAQRYVNMFGTEVYEKHRKFSPVENLL